ncbi:MAG: hypothetical protein ACXIT9_12595 [Nitritalea sp.]
MDHIYSALEHLFQESEHLNTLWIETPVREQEAFLNLCIKRTYDTNKAFNNALMSGNYIIGDFLLLKNMETLGWMFHMREVVADFLQNVRLEETPFTVEEALLKTLLREEEALRLFISKENPPKFSEAFLFLENLYKKRKYTQFKLELKIAQQQSATNMSDLEQFPPNLHEHEDAYLITQLQEQIKEMIQLTQYIRSEGLFYRASHHLN